MVAVRAGMAPRALARADAMAEEMAVLRLWIDAGSKDTFPCTGADPAADEATLLSSSFPSSPLDMLPIVIFKRCS